MIRAAAAEGANIILLQVRDRGAARAGNSGGAPRAHAAAAVAACCTLLDLSPRAFMRCAPLYAACVCASLQLCA